MKSDILIILALAAITNLKIIFYHEWIPATSILISHISFNSPTGPVYSMAHSVMRKSYNDTIHYSTMSIKVIGTDLTQVTIMKSYRMRKSRI